MSIVEFKVRGAINRLLIPHWRIRYSVIRPKDVGGVTTFSNAETQDVRRLGRKIMEETTRRKLPEARRQIAEGQTVAFGLYFAISRDGLHYKGEKVPWGHVDGVRLKAGSVCVDVIGGGAWATEPLSTISNPFVFLQLAHSLVDPYRAGGR